MSELEISRLTGAGIEPVVPELARLRTVVFREYPYLYDGGWEYEAEYLKVYTQAPQCLCVIVRDEDRIVGASTGLPLEDAEPDFQRAFSASDLDPKDVFYFGESVLLPAYRGRGLGHTFIDEREAYARSLGRTVAAFCAVERPADHPRRPANYRPLDDFWRKRGYERRPDLRTTYPWKDVGDDDETDHPMVFWLKSLTI